jgi:rhomboid family GlyGly-CTERM serine protease
MAWLSIGVVVVALLLAGRWTLPLLRYDSAAIVSGEAWRLVTGHFVHLGWIHGLVNLACLAACAFLLGGRWRPWPTVLLLAGLTGLLLLAGAPSVSRYAGFSGLIYGLAVLGLAPHARRDWLAASVLLLVCVRVGWQVVAGPSATEAAWIGGPVVAQGHVAGIAAALFLLAACRWVPGMGGWLAPGLDAEKRVASAPRQLP